MLLTKKSLALSHFDKIVSKMQNFKIKSVFTLSSPSWGNHRGFRTYSADSELYILFENDICLIMTYKFIDSLKIVLRKMDPEEKAKYEASDIKDFFNTSNDIYDAYAHRRIRNERCSLSYDCIKDITLRTVTSNYTKWIDGNIDFVSPTEETFDEIRIIMNNGKSIVICADDAEVDGYILVWSKDAEETIVKYE